MVALDCAVNLENHQLRQFVHSSYMMQFVMIMPEINGTENYSNCQNTGVAVMMIECAYL